MRLYDEIFRNTLNGGDRYTAVVGGGGYFEGVKRVGDFSPEKVVLEFSRCGVEVDGEGLFIKKYCDGDLELSGKIRKVTLLDGKQDEKTDGRA